MEIKGEKVVLAPIKRQEKDEFYQLVMKSYGSRFWYDKGQKAKRTKKKFFKTDHWNSGYFDSNLPEKGQCFWIIVGGEKIGQVNYNKIDIENKNVDLDIIIGAKKNMGKGYGTDALKTLIKYLFSSFDINKVWIEPRANNPRAIVAYQKVGFKKEGLLREQNYFEGKFTDCLRLSILKKEFEKKSK